MDKIGTEIIFTTFGFLRRPRNIGCVQLSCSGVGFLTIMNMIKGKDERDDNCERWNFENYNWKRSFIHNNVFIKTKVFFQKRYNKQ